MSIRHLRTLIAVSEHGSFAAAAEAVALTQSAVSQQMKALEEELGLELFDRRKRPPQLNPTGKALIPRVRQLLYLYDGLGDRAAGPAGLEGLLEVGSVPPLLTNIVPRALAALRASQPSLQVRLTSGPSAELLARLDRRDLDAVLLSEPKPVPGGMTWRPVLEEPLMVIAPADTESRDYRELLTSLPFIRFNRSAWVGITIQTALQDLGIEVNEAMELDSLEAIREMVRHGLGVSVVPLSQSAPGDGDRLRSVPFGSPPRTRTLGMLERQQHVRTGLTAALYRELLAAAVLGDTAPTAG